MGDDRTKRAGLRGGRWLAVVILLVGLGAGAAATRFVQSTVDNAGRARFDLEVEHGVQAIVRRMEAYVATIRSGAALFYASEVVTPAEFQRFEQAIDLRRNYPGIQGLGFSMRLEGTPEERAAEVRDGLRWSGAEPPAAVGESAVVMIEPLDDRNRAVLGFDMYGEAVRRAAMERARDTGQPAASGRVRLIQEITPGDRQAGFLIYVPVYGGTTLPETIEERRARLVGWVFATFRARDLVHGIFGPDLDMDMAIYADEEPAPDALLFRTAPLAPISDRLRSIRRLDVAGRTWTVVVEGAAGPRGSEALLPPLVLAASAAVAVLLFAIAWSLVQKREDVEETNERLRQAEAERTHLLRAERRARRESERARERSTFLAEVSTLLASSLAAPDLLDRLARRVVPFLGDGCAIHLWEPDGSLRQAVVAYDDPAVQEQVRAFYEGMDITGSVSPTIREVAESGRPILVSDVPRTLVGEPRVRLAEQLLGSMIVVPLVARSGVLGTLTCTAEEQGRFGNTELELASDLGRRVALAIENTRLFAGAQEAIRVRDDFLSIASHELRTPLTALQAHLQGLIRQLGRVADGVDPTVVRGRLETALRQTRRLGKLVNELLDVSRITAGKLQLEQELVDVVELARDLLDRFDEEARRAGSEIRLRAPPSATGVWDRSRIEQVIANLLSNAIKYGAGEPVDLEIETTPDLLRMRVRDRGIGIPYEAQARIFDRFERASSERNYGGLGLGLYITREIVAAHGGTIRVHSAPGAGACFEVVLPRGVRPGAEARV